MDLRTLPKVELHRHLEGAVRLSTIMDLAREAGLPVPAGTPEGLAPHAQILAPVRDLAEALEKFGLAQRSFHGYGAVTRIAREAVEDLAADNVRLAELRFSPDFMCRPAGLDWDRAMEALLEGIEEGRRANDVEVGVIVIASRDYGVESAERTVRFALRHRARIAGFDVAGNEVGYPPRMFAGALGPLRDAGVPLTVHYGEATGPEFPREAIELLGPSRLGHGVSVAFDPRVTELAMERGVTLEMCPTSNVMTRAVGGIEDHPAPRLLRQGVRVTLNTDDPGLFGIDLTHELEVARDRFGFGPPEFAAVTRNALEASFVPEDRVAAVRRRHFAWLEGAPLPA